MPAYPDIAAWPRGERFDPLGLGDTAITDVTCAIQRPCDTPRWPSIRPCRGVGCAQLDYVKGGNIVGIEGDPASHVKDLFTLWHAPA